VPPGRPAKKRSAGSNGVCPTSSTRPCSTTSDGGQRGRLDTEAQWTEGRRYLGLDVLSRTRLTRITDNAEPKEVTDTDIQALTASHPEDHAAIADTPRPGA
jgi:hypothetical protein